MKHKGKLIIACILALLTIAITLSLLWLEAATKTLPPSITEHKEKAFDVSLDALKDNAEQYSDNVINTVSFLLVGIGWVLTSKETRTLIGSTRWVQVLLLIALTLITTTHIIVLCARKYASAYLLSRLGEINMIPFEYYKYYQITSFQLATSLIVDVSIAIFLWVMLYKAK